VYIILGSTGRPIYVGATKSFANRWRGRLLSAYQLGLTSAEGGLPRPVTVYFGRLPANHVSQPPIRAAVEHVVVRALIRGQLVKPGELRNSSSILELRVKGEVSISGLLPPSLLAGVRPMAGLAGNALKLGNNSLFELRGG
jgi:hypothetical protein